jgi:hypothetical protein
MQTLAKATAATTNSTIELILTPRPRAGYAGIESRVGFRMITSFPENGFVAGLRRRSGARFCPAPTWYRKRTKSKDRCRPGTEFRGRLTSCRAAFSCETDVEQRPQHEEEPSNRNSEPPAILLCHESPARVCLRYGDDRLSVSGELCGTAHSKRERAARFVFRDQPALDSPQTKPAPAAFLESCRDYFGRWPSHRACHRPRGPGYQAAGRALPRSRSQ